MSTVKKSKSTVSDIEAAFEEHETVVSPPVQVRPVAAPPATAPQSPAALRADRIREALKRLHSSTPKDLAQFMSSASAEQVAEYHAARAHAREVLDS